MSHHYANASPTTVPTIPANLRSQLNVNLGNGAGDLKTRGRLSQESARISETAFRHNALYGTQQQVTTPRSHREHSDQRSPSVVGDRFEYVDKRVPRRVVYEKKVKKTKMVPQAVEEEVMKEEVIEIKEKIIEVAEPVEEPSPKVVQKEIIKERKIKQVQYVDKPNDRIEYKEKIVESPTEVQYVEVPFEKIVEVPEYDERVVYNQVEVPQFVDRPYPVHVDFEHHVDVHRRIPVPMEVETAYTFELPALKPKYKRKELPIYAPRFVEVPVPAELMDAESQRMAIHLREQIHTLAAQEAPSLVEVEKIAKFAKDARFAAHISCTDYQQAIETAWRNKQLTLQNSTLQSIGVHAPHSRPSSQMPCHGRVSSPPKFSYPTTFGRP